MKGKEAVRMHDKVNVKIVCSFCVSDLHLVTMLLPYLDKKVKEKEKFITIIEKDLTQQVKLVLSRLTLNDQSKNELLNICWTSKGTNEISKICDNANKVTIIVNGTKDYIEAVNQNLDKLFEGLNNEIKVINCYDITKLDDDIKDILNTHDIILNTSGEKEISEVFEGYEKRKYA